MTESYVYLTDSATVLDASVTTTDYGVVNTEAIKLHFAPYTALSVVMAQNLTVHDAPLYKWIAGALIAEIVKLKDVTGPNVTYDLYPSDIIKIAQALNVAIPASLTQNMTVHQTATIVLGILLLQKIKLADASAQTTMYGLNLRDGVSVLDGFYNFVNLSLSDSLTVGTLQSYQYQAIASMAENFVLGSMFGNQMVFNLTTAENLEFTDEQVMNMIFQGDPLLDTLLLTALYVSPSGNYTTWAINTRTNAITEYRNWVYNSFASIGRKYIAADSEGLYELNGERDVTENIDTKLQTAMMQLAGTKLSGLKGIYIGMDVTQGNNVFFAKLIAGDGREYVYKFVSQPNLMTTKVNIGKGLRSRYFSFVLESTGPDFDLDTIEFVPMIGKRRV